MQRKFNDPNVYIFLRSLDISINGALLKAIHNYLNYFQETTKSKFNKMSIVEKTELDRVLSAQGITSSTFNFKNKLTCYDFCNKFYDQITKKIAAVADTIVQIEKVKALQNKINHEVHVSVNLEEVKKDLSAILANCHVTVAADKKSQDLSNAILLSMQTVDNQFVRQEMINELNIYKHKREAEAESDILKGKKLQNSFKTFFGWFANFSAEVKMNAADKMMRALADEKVEFTSTDILALRDSRLAKITQKLENLQMLPQAYIKKKNEIIKHVDIRATLRS